jgi:uncharacterized membrane protein YgdD (TMEM256/DUF423 family)
VNQPARPTPPATHQASLPGGIRRGALALAVGYAALLASLFFRDALALVILLPLGGVMILIGILLWARAATREAKSKGML